MYTAIPLQGDSLANHFTKASTFALLDQNGMLVKKIDNPAIQSGCEGKSQLVEILKAHQVNRVVVKNIGERMLSKLLNLKFVVRQANRRSVDISTLFNHMAEFPELIEASEGRESVNYHNKQKQGGGCKHGHHHDSVDGSEKKGKCCQSKGKQKGQYVLSNRAHEGKGRCCQR
jgi:predicted Fe-Mo cluster-binding NifX family protein